MYKTKQPPLLTQAQLLYLLLLHLCEMQCIAITQHAVRASSLKAAILFHNHVMPPHNMDIFLILCLCIDNRKSYSYNIQMILYLLLNRNHKGPLNLLNILLTGFTFRKALMSATAIYSSQQHRNVFFYIQSCNNSYAGKKAQP